MFDEYGKMIVDKIDNGEKLTEQELKEIRDYSIKDIKGDESRWTVSIDSILKMCDRYFMLTWDRGLTEYQENEFYNQPYEVEERTKTVIVTEWVDKRKEL